MFNAATKNVQEDAIHKCMTCADPKKKIPGGKVRRLLAFAGGGGGGAVTYIW